ncbi:MAG: DUF2357 domain-containing protein, partial [Clostridia bacterium]
MAEKITKEVYLQYAKKIVSVLSGEAFYSQYKKRVDSGVSNFKLVKKRLVQDISLDWIDTIEDCLPNLDTIVRNPRKFIVQEEDIVDVSLAKSISTESIKHLAQHTNMISKVDKDGTVTPNRILNITKEESFEIYENRFIYTLLLKLKDFVTLRYDKIKKASATQDVLELDVESRFNLPSKKIIYRTEYFAQLSFDEVMQLDPETLTKIERIAKIDRIITDFLSSSFAKSMRNSAPVRPPITRTNVILKEQNFKKALTLWQFVETYQQSGGFATSDDVEEYPIADESMCQLKDMVTLNTMLFESMYDQHETNFDMADAEFADVLRIGEMNFQPDQIDRDQYAQKLDDSEKNQEEEKTEEVKAEESAEVEEQEELKPPEPEIEEKEVEKPVDKEKEIEAPPHEEPQDEEPDADEFDKHLFDIRKLYKRPQEDKLRQEEIIKIKDAIDRCLISYRKIKQEEIDERDREDKLRRQREEVEKRAEAFRRQRDAVEKEYREVVGINSKSTFLGLESFRQQAAKIVLPSKDTDFQKEHSDLFVQKNKNEALDLEDKNTTSILTSISAMEAEQLAASQKHAEEDENLQAEAAKLDALQAEANAKTRDINRNADEIDLPEMEMYVPPVKEAVDTDKDNAADTTEAELANATDTTEAENVKISENAEAEEAEVTEAAEAENAEAEVTEVAEAENAEIAENAVATETEKEIAETEKTE